MNKIQSRRTVLKTLAAAGAASLASAIGAVTSMAQNAEIAKPSIDFGFSLYGMRSLPLADAIKTCASIGYDCVELVAVEGWPCDPGSLSTESRREIRKHLEDSELTVPALMEDLTAVVDAERHRKNIDRLKAAAELGHSVSPNKAPVIETVLGGRPGDWDSQKVQMVKSLTHWARAGEAARTIIAAKAHVSGALHTPADAKWLVNEVGSPWLKLVYDFSHFQLGGFKLEDSLKAMLADTVFIHVKDTEGMKDRFRFLLPGDGKIDYRRYFEILKSAAKSTANPVTTRKPRRRGVTRI
jgi:inosose dehydratase